jgi:tetratricopeptide (TPR) repeat protein
MKPVSMRYAASTIGKADPDMIRNLADRERWWTDEIALLVIDRVEELLFHDGKEGAKAAHHLKLWLSRIRDCSPDVQARARAVIGSSARRMGDFPAAIHHYREAIALCGQSGETRAFVLSRYAVLLMVTGSGDEALASIGKAMNFDRRPESQARLLALRSGVYAGAFSDYGRAIRDASEALGLCDLRSDPRTFLSCARNLADWLARGSGSIEDLRSAGLMLRVARRVFSNMVKGGASYGVHGSSLGLLIWSEGLIESRLGSYRSAVSKLSRARSRLIKASEFKDGLLVGIDLAEAHENAGDREAALLECEEGARIARIAGFETVAMAFEAVARRSLAGSLEALRGEVARASRPSAGS